MSRRPRNPVAFTLSSICLGAAAVIAAPQPWGAVRAQTPDPAPSPSGAAKVQSVLHKTADFYKKNTTIAVELERSQKVGPIALKVTTSVAFGRPNRLSVRSKGLRRRGRPGQRWEEAVRLDPRTQEVHRRRGTGHDRCASQPTLSRRRPSSSR